MTWEIAIVLLLVAVTLVQFIRERWPTDLTGLVAFAALLLLSQIPGSHSFPSAGQLLRVFANAAPITVAAMFVLTYALEQTGAISRFLVAIEKMGNLGTRGLLLVMMLGTAVVSAFINNTPVVVVGLPVAMHLAKRANASASIFLIPLSYGAVFGGCCTLVGTSTNILASGLLSENGHPPLGMFEIGAVGLPAALIGIAYVAWFAPKLLPARRTLTQDIEEGGISEYVIEAIVQEDSPAAGRTLTEAGLGPHSGMRVIEVTRGGGASYESLATLRLRAGDRLVIAGAPSAVATILAMPGVNLQAQRGRSAEMIATHEGHLAEAIVGPLSEFNGRSLRDLNFRQRQGLVVLAIHRRGINLSRGFENVPLQPGDTLLVLGVESSIDQLRRSSDLLLLDRPRVTTMVRRADTALVLGALAAVIITATMEWIPIEVGSLTACAFLMMSGVIKPRQAYRSIDWSLMFLIFSTLGLGMAMESTGAAKLIAENLTAAATALVSEPWKPLVLLATVYLITMVATEMLSNNATVVLMMPIALGLAMHLGLDARPFAIAITLASSAAFATPIGYQTNTYVYSAGGYRFADFLRLGAPLNLLYFATAMLIIPAVWPFHR